MVEELKKRVRDAVMDTFRAWGGQWNVTPTPPGSPDAPADAWLLRVHSRPVVRGTISAETVEAYLEQPEEAEAVARWERELRPTFDEASEQAP